MKAPKLLVIFNNKAPIICILLGLLIFFSGLLMVFDIIPDSLIYRLSLFARDGKINDINDVMISLIAFGKMFLVLGLTILIFGIIFLYLTNNIEENHIDTLFDEREKYPLINIEKNDYYLIFPIILFLIMCLPTMTHSLWWDEAWTMRYVNSWKSMFAPDYSNNHLLNTFFIKVFITIIGEREWVIRLPALFSGLVTLIGVYFLTKQIEKSIWFALFSTLITATSYGIIFTSINARGYAFIMSVSVWTAIILINTITIKSLSKEHAILLFLFTTLGIITIPISALSIIALLIPFIFLSVLEKKMIRTTLQLFYVTFYSAIFVLMTYNISLPIRLIAMANTVQQDVNIYYFLINKLSHWINIPEFEFMTMLLFFIVFFGFYHIYLKNKGLFVYLSILIIFSVLAHINSGWNPFWYSSMGMVFIPYVVACFVFLLGKVFNKNNQKANFSTIILAFIFLSIITFNIKNTMRLWEPRSKIESITDSFQDYQNTYGKNVGVIRQTPPIQYYFNKKNINYTSFANVDELLSSKFDFDLVISRDLNKENYHKVKGYELLFIDGWADSFYILYKEKKYFNNST